MSARPSRRGGRRFLALGLLGALGCAASACSSVGSSSPTTTSRPPPVPKDLVAYVTTVGSGSAAGTGDGLVRVDLTTRTVGPRITVGTFPAAIALAAGHAYTANYESNTVSDVLLSSGRVVRSLAAGTGPAGVAVTADGSRVYVTDAGTSPLGTTLTPIVVKTAKREPPIAVGAGPEGIALTPDGREAYVANTGAVVTGQAGAIGDTVSVVDLAQGKTVRTLKVGNAPEALAVSPDGSVVYVANSNSESVTPIQTASQTPGAAIALPGPPQAIAFNPSGTTAFVAVSSKVVPRGGELVPIDVATGQAGSPLPVCAGPSAVALAPGGATAWVSCFGANELVPVTLATRKVGTPLKIAAGPYALALTTEPRRVTPTHPKKTTA